MATRYFCSAIDLFIFLKQTNFCSDCPPPTNVLLIVLPIVIGIVVLGVIALIAWKIYQTIRDKREWVNFENEMKKSKWTKVFGLVNFRVPVLLHALKATEQ